MESANYSQEELEFMQQQQQQHYMNDLPDPLSGRTRSINQDQMFMKWLFSFRKEVVEPLSFVWRGYEFDHTQNEWVKNKSATPIMNEKGINWCISFIDSYINPVYVVSNYDEQFMNYSMREVCKVTWNSLSKRWKEFGIKDKTDIPRIQFEIESKVLSILLGARGDGFRRFFAQQYRISEVHNSNMTQEQAKNGMMARMLNMFTPRGDNLK